MLNEHKITLYVAPNGSDENNGSIHRPFLTIGRAVAFIGAIANKIDEATIYLRQGTYYLERPLELNQETLGYRDLKLTLASMDGEEATISGAAQVQLDWEPYDGNIYVANVGAGRKIDAVYVNDQRRIMSRYPNYEENKTLNGYAADAISKERVARWKNPNGGYIRALHFGEWGGNSYVITGKTPDHELQYEWVGDNNRGSDMHEFKRMVENIFEELDVPGEWFYDKDTGRLYYYPLDVRELSEASYSIVTTEELIRVTGESWERPFRNLQIKEISFVRTHRTLFTGTYERPLRGDWGMVRVGAIFLENAENISVCNSKFVDMGGNAITISGYNKDHLVDFNDFTHIGATGVLVFGKMSAVRDPSTYDGDNHKTEIHDFIPGPQSEDYPRKITISNNYFYDIGTNEKQAAAVCMSISEFVTVSKNTVHHASRAGINIHDGTFGGHIIEGNDLFDCVTETADHGPINAWGRDRFWSVPQHDARGYFGKEKRAFALLDARNTSIIRNNRVHATYAFGIDIDDGASNYEICNNLCIGVGIKLREGFDRRVHNNMLIGSNLEIHCSYARNNDLIYSNIILKRNICNTVLINEDATTFYCNNVYWNMGSEVVDLPPTDHNSIVEDPMFADLENNNFTVKAESPALKQGFVNFPMSDSDFGRADKPKPPKFTYIDVAQSSEVYKFYDGVLSNITNEGLRSAAGLPDLHGAMVLDRAVKGIFTKIGLPIGAGDVIRKINGQVILNVDDFITVFENIPVKTPVPIEFFSSQLPKVLTFIKPKNLPPMNKE